MVWSSLAVPGYRDDPEDGFVFWKRSLYSLGVVPLHARVLGTVCIAGIWVFLLLLCTAIFLEYGGGLRLYQHLRYSPPTTLSLQRKFLKERYKPFTVQYLHPFTLFSFPLSSTGRIAMSNETVHLGGHGYRGPGPGERGGRQLAFLLGGSTAFGHFATSDVTTITGYLNRLQEKYFFVNAGVPSWNTTQELTRLIHEILPERPALVLSLDGANDAFIAVDYAQMDQEYPMGTPESFGVLDQFVDDLRAQKKQPSSSWIQRLFPELHRHTRNVWFSLVGRSSDGLRNLSREEQVELARRVAQKYGLNVRAMRTLTREFGGRFTAILQPMRDLHTGSEELWDSAFHREFRRRVLGEFPSLPIRDFTAVFDRSPRSQAFVQEFSDPHEFFVDRVHLTDEGNAVVAERIVDLLKREGLL